jgi:hypothetical protein
LVFLGSVYTTGGITQTFLDTAGALLNINGQYAGNGGPPSSLQISFNGVDLVNLNPGPSDNLWHNFTATVTATGSDTLTVTSYQLPAYNLVDNFSVSAVPGPIAGAGLLPALLGLLGFAAWRCRQQNA